MESYLQFNKSFIFDFTKEGFVTTISHNNITGIHKCKKVVLGDIEFNDNLRITTNKGFIIEILHKEYSPNDNEYIYRMLFEDKPHQNLPSEVGENYHDLIAFLNNVVKGSTS